MYILILDDIYPANPKCSEIHPKRSRADCGFFVVFEHVGPAGADAESKIYEAFAHEVGHFLGRDSHTGYSTDLMTRKEMDDSSESGLDLGITSKKYGNIRLTTKDIQKMTNEGMTTGVNKKGKL